MIRILLVLCCALLPLAPAQQPNLGGASLTFNGVAGPPYPIGPVPLSLAAVFHTVAITGIPNVPVSVWIAPGTAPVGAPIPGSADLVDLVVPGAAPAFTVNLPGPGTLTLVLALAGVPVGTGAAFQGLVVDPTVPVGFRLTAATNVVVVP